MTAPNVIRSGVGFRNCVIYALDASGYPDAPATAGTLYEGITVSGVKELTLEEPEPEFVEHFGDDRIFAVDILPAKSSMGGEIRVGKANDTVDAAVTGGNLSFTIGEAKLFPVATDNRGSEDQVGMLVYRQSLDTDPTSSTYGKRLWEFKILPRTYVIPREGGFNENPEDKAYTIRPMVIGTHLWGETFTSATEGCNEAQALRGVSEYKPHVVAWTTDAAETTFSFHASRPSQAAGKVKTWLDGTVVTADTVGTASLIWTTAPTAGTLVAFYEYE